MQVACKWVIYLHGSVIQSHCPELLWPHWPFNPPYICGSVVKLTRGPPQEPTPLRFAVRLRIPKPMLPSPASG